MAPPTNGSDATNNTASNNPQAGQGRPLPKKEGDLFKNVVKHYEQKQYKKAIKQADAILRKYPNHGETLAMKGLVLNNMIKRDEAHTLVKQGLMNDMRSVQPL
jgi:tetratricopeptide (TPR) repeat protein